MAGIGISLVAAFAEGYLKAAKDDEKNQWKKLGFEIGEAVARDAKTDPGKYYDAGVEISKKLKRRKKR